MNGKKNQYKKVNIGFTMDENDTLRVPVIHNCNSLNYEEIKKKYISLLKNNIDNKIDIIHLRKLTFTISDLSSIGDVSFHTSLIAKNTCASLGIAIDKINKSIDLSLMYDHQMSSGKESLKFINKLRDEIINLM